MIDAQKVGAFIRDQRKKRHLSQKQLAESLYVSPTAISKWECGANLPEITKLKPMAEIFDLTIEEILNGEKTPEPTISPPLKKAFPKTKAVLLISSIFIVGAAAILGLYFYITVPRFHIVDSYYGVSQDTLHIENAFCIVVEYDGRVSQDDFMEHGKLIREEYQDYFEEVDAISIVYYDKYDATAPSLRADFYTTLLPIPDFSEYITTVY